MAKKRKLTTPKSTDSSTATQQSQQPKKIQKKNQNQQQDAQEQAKKQQLEQEKQQQLEKQQEVEEEEEEYEEFEEEIEEEQVEDVEEEEDDDGEEDKEETKQNDVDNDDETISNLLEPFTKDQLTMILREAAEIHPDVASSIRKVADEDTVHRKIFVHGLGWDTTEDTLRSAFNEYGEIEDCKSVTDKVSGKSKGYGFILFKTRTGAKKALEDPHKKIGNRMTACQLAAVGPVLVGGSGMGFGGSVGRVEGPVSEYTQRKIYVSNVSADIDPQKLLGFFSKFGEIEEGPLGLDKATGKPKGFCLFAYKSVESAKKALEEPHKQFEGHVLHCQKAIDGPKSGKQSMGGPSRGGRFGGRGENPNLAGAIGGGPAIGAGLMGQSVGGVGFNQGAAGGAGPGLNPALGQALTALLASQGAGLGLNNLLGSLGGGVPGAGAHGAYGVQGVGVNPSVLGGYGTQGGLQCAYPNQQMGQGGSGRSQHGLGPYNGH